MREIKFKMWNKEELKMYEVGQIDFQNERAYMKNWWASTQSFFPFSMVQILQYTGLKDGNGIEIYEGDLVREDDEIWLVLYDSQDAMFTIFHDNITENFSNVNSKWFEVIRKHIRKSRVIGRRIEMLKIKDKADMTDTKTLVGIMQQIDSAYKEYEGTYCDHRGIGTKAYLTKRIDILREELLNLKKSLK